MIAAGAAAEQHDRFRPRRRRLFDGVNHHPLDYGVFKVRLMRERIHGVSYHNLVDPGAVPYAPAPALMSTVRRAGFTSLRLQRSRSVHLGHGLDDYGGDPFWSSSMILQRFCGLTGDLRRPWSIMGNGI